ncbi:MAG: thioredoxin-like negative regulator of GroEL [Arcticibacterium sp.]|jgi:thioredoxin-like negative regulator of GroEL
MSGGLKTGNHFLIVLSIGALISIGLYALPKTLVSNETKTSAKPARTESKGHAELTEKQQSGLLAIRSSNDSELLKLEALTTYFSTENIFDSAGYYAGLLAENEPSEGKWLKSADLYYQAYSLSLNPLTREELAEITRFSYQKVLELNPNQLHAKTNSAMTFATSGSPMQTIMMLRQVLDQDPRYVPAIMSMGALSMQSGQYEKAVERFRQVLAIDANNINAKLGLAYSWIETGKVTEAKKLLEEISSYDVGEVLQNEIRNTLKSLN